MALTQEIARFASEEAAAPPPPHWHRGAIAALLLSILSSLSLVSLPFWLLAVAATVLALLALASIARSPGVYRGRGLAAVGLCAALFFLGYGATEQFYRESLMHRRSQELVNDWFQLVLDDRMREAHHLTLNTGQRIAEGESLADYYADFEHERDLRGFGSRTEVSTLRGLKTAKIDLLRSRFSQSSPKSEQFTHNYRITAEQEGKPWVVDAEVVVERCEQAPGRWYWRIHSTSSTARKLE